MPKKTPTNILINQVNVRPVNRTNIDIQKWRAALKTAESMSKNRQQLYDVYEEIMLDAHLKSITEKRINAVVNLEIKFFDKNNQENEELTKIISTSYFETLLKEIAKAKLWGISLMEIDWSNKEGYLNKTYTIDRKHVKPEFGIVALNPGDMQGVDYVEHPFAIFAGDADFGLLLQACPLVIFKRNNISDWADFNELFGKPYPQGSYTNTDTADLLTQAFEKAGFGAYMVAPEDAKIILHQGNTGTSNENYKALREAMNEELSILILGQTLTSTVGATGSYAASKTHSDVEESIHTTDREFVMRVLNESLIPVLIRSGFKADGSFQFVYGDDVNLTERILIDTQLSAIVPIDDDYFYETYNIPKPTGNSTAIVKEPKAKTDIKSEKLKFKDKFQRIFFQKRAVLKF